MNASAALSSSENRTRWFAAALALITLAAYGNTFSVPFLFDDPSSITTNPTVRHLWPPWGALAPPPYVTVSGRPLVNVTFALNYALSGYAPWSYHALNLAIHLAAGLTLFGLVRRTLERPCLAARFGAHASALGFIAAAIWLLHPLQTEAVTYTVQRVESLMGLCYLFTLYAFVRSVDSPARGRWLSLAVIACLGGMACKEVMVTAPLLVFLYDRTFVAGSFAEAWRRRARFHGALAGTWLLLAGLVLGTGGRGGTAGFGTEISASFYALTQTHALATYLKLSLWPHPLVFDYGAEVVKSAAAATLPGLAVALALAATGWALGRRPAAGFLGAWFFAILAPSSSVVPVATQTIAEHRMYLPLAAVVVAGVLFAAKHLGERTILGGTAIALGLGGLTFARNRIYGHELELWTLTTAQRPDNPRAHYNLAVSLTQAGRKREAVPHYERTLELDPTYAEAHNNLGVLLAELGRPAEAWPHYEAALRIDAQNPEAHNNLGHALTQTGRIPEALPHFETALRLRPDYAEAHNNFGDALVQSGRATDALPHFVAALRLWPTYPEARSNYGSALLQLGRTPEAIAQLEEALRLRPDFVEAHSNLGLALIGAGRNAEAAVHYEAVLRVAPRDATAHSNLGYLALQSGRVTEAVAHYQVVAEERPGEPESHFNLGVAQLRAGQRTAAIAAFERALQIRPDYVEARQQLVAARAALGP